MVGFQALPKVWRIHATPYTTYRRPTGVPTKDLLAYDIPALLSQKESLQTYLKELRAESDIEKSKIQQAVQKMEDTEKLIETLLAKNERTIEVLSTIPSL